MKSAYLVGASIINDISFFQERKDCFSVACDGGYSRFLQAGIEPDLLVADFDTFPKEKVQHPKQIIQLNPIKDDTDTFYALKWLIKQGYEKIYLYGCLGGKIEHTIANLQLLSYLSDRHIQAYAYTENNQTVVHMIQNSCIRFNKLASGYISVFAYNNQANGVTEKGLKYTIENATLTSDVPLGVSNEFIGEEASISVKEGKLLLVMPKGCILDERQN